MHPVKHFITSIMFLIVQQFLTDPSLLQGVLPPVARILLAVRFVWESLHLRHWGSQSSSRTGLTELNPQKLAEIWLVSIFCSCDQCPPPPFFIWSSAHWMLTGSRKGHCIKRKKRVAKPALFDNWFELAGNVWVEFRVTYKLQHYSERDAPARA